MEKNEKQVMQILHVAKGDMYYLWKLESQAKEEFLLK